MLEALKSDSRCVKRGRMQITKTVDSHCQRADYFPLL